MTAADIERLGACDAASIVLRDCKGAFAKAIAYAKVQRERYKYPGRGYALWGRVLWQLESARDVRSRRLEDRQRRYIRAAIAIMRRDRGMAADFAEDLREIADEVDPQKEPEPTIGDVLESANTEAVRLWESRRFGEANSILTAIDKLDRFLVAERITLD